MIGDQRIEQAWAEIRDTFADSMLNQSQKETFVKSILSGVLANPPGLEAVPEGTEEAIKSALVCLGKIHEELPADPEDYVEPPSIKAVYKLLYQAEAILTRHRATQDKETT